MAQSFCVIKFYQSIKEIEKASDIGIRRGQKEYPIVTSSLLMKRKECLKTQNGTRPLVHKLHFVIILAPGDSFQAIK